ncbi:hypothetical protein, partial [Klebsiella pneumoniae]|uniref:hypothetical protein n=1 Tax=Klebsiella pneumoniae TaxID=573 RepID=UPI001BE12B4E
ISNPAHHSWVRQDQLLVSLLIASLTEEVLPLVVGLETSRDIYRTHKTSLASASHTRIMQIHLDLHNLKQDDMFVTTY